MTRKEITILSIVSLFFGVLPLIIIISSLGYYPKLPVELIDDSLYYLSRVSEVMKGHIFIGNSYLYEHVWDTTTAFFVADWLYSIPFFLVSVLSLSFSVGFVFSQVFWTCINVFLLYVLFKKIEIDAKYILWALLFTVLSMIIFIWRPVAMAVVYPVFIIFLIFFLLWLQKPEGEKETLFLVLSSSFSFYVYTYLWQIVLMILLLLTGYFIVTKQKIKRVFLILISTFILSIPVFIYTFKQVTSQFYFETLKRVGLINTHTVGSSAILYSAIIFVSLLILYILGKRDVISKKHLMFFSTVFVSLFITGVSNILSGKDLEVAVHIGRFTELFVFFFLIFLTNLFYKEKIGKDWRILSLYSMLFLYCVFLLYSSILVVINQTKNVNNNDQYLPVLEKLNTLDGNIILADDKLASYIPLATKKYVVFHPNAELYLLPNNEAEERYLVSRIFSNLTEEELKLDYRKYAGVGNAVHEANVINRDTKICLIIQKLFGNKCGSFVNSYDIRGEKYFRDLMDRYKIIVNNKRRFLQMYNVDTIVIDKNADNWRVDGDLKFVKVFNDDRFIILTRQ